MCQNKIPQGESVSYWILYNRQHNQQCVKPEEFKPTHSGSPLKGGKTGLSFNSFWLFLLERGEPSKRFWDPLGKQFALWQILVFWVIQCPPECTNPEGRRLRFWLSTVRQILKLTLMWSTVFWGFVLSINSTDFGWRGGGERLCCACTCKPRMNETHPWITSLPVADVWPWNAPLKWKKTKQNPNNGEQKKGFSFHTE